jgi:hypothetical protein
MQSFTEATAEICSSVINSMVLRLYFFNHK